MRTPDFIAALSGVLAEAAEHRTAIMCSETVWWRCHRRLIADHAALLEGADVSHLMPPGAMRGASADRGRPGGGGPAALRRVLTLSGPWGEGPRASLDPRFK
ncbi:DUF488 domain-containing protein [Sinomonas mesophila]|uniref:DUF488 family protein n=1 Tax=Sinomonas mesophila TaxID=1531955 RepID=UPI001C378BB0